MENVVAKQKDNRMLFLDIAKIIGIMLMVYAHARERGIEIMYIYAFHMPVFFVINGMTFRIKEGESAGDFLIKKIKGYIISFIILAFLIIVVDMSFAAAKGQTVDWKFFLDKLVYVYQNPRPYPLWFLLALFFSDIWLYLFIRISFKKDYLVLLYSLISLTLILLFYKYHPQKLAHSFDVSFVGVFFVTLGYLFMREWNKKPREFILNNRWISLGIGIVLLAACFLLVFYLRQQDPTSRARLEMWGNNYKPFYIRIPGAIFGSFGLIFLCNTISNKPMAFFGRHTLVVLAFQQNLTIKWFKDYVANGWYKSIAPLPENSSQAVWFTIVCVLFTLAVLIPLSVLLFDTHCAYIFMRKPATWYLKLIDNLKKKPTT